LGKFFFIQYLYKNRGERENSCGRKKGSCIQKKERQKKTIYRVKWPPFLSKQAKEDPRES